MQFQKKVLVCLLGSALATPISAWAFLDSVLQAAQVAGAAQANGANAQVVQQACSAKTGTACPKVNIKPTRPTPELDKLLTGDAISGADLMTEMRAMRSAIASHNLNNAMQGLMGFAAAPGNIPAASGGFFGSLFGAASDVLLDTLTAEMSYQALDYFFAQMSDNPNLLREVKVTLPKSDPSMSPELKQQLVSMGTFLVAIKASGKILDASEKDFDSASQSYRKVLDSRAAVAKLLGDAFYAKEGLFASDKEAQARNQQYLSAADRDYLEAFRDKKPEEFLRDFNAQNIALTYLSRSNPKEYANYRLEVDEFKTHYGAYARTAVGAASMVGFSAMFIKKAKNVLEKNGLAGASPLMSLAGDGLTELITLAPRISKTLTRSPDSQDGTFAVRLPNKESKRELSAAKVFSQLGDEAKQDFQRSLFKSGQPGYFGSLGEKYPLVAGQIMDSLVEKESRKALIKGYLQQEDIPDFSFQNALGDSGKTARQLKASLFRSVPDIASTQEDEKAIALVQKDIRDKLAKWDNSTLRRVMFANKAANLPAGQLDVGGYLVSIESPGMKGIMEYEEMAIAGAAHATTTKVESDRPGAKAADKDKSKAKKAK